MGARDIALALREHWVGILQARRLRKSLGVVPRSREACGQLGDVFDQETDSRTSATSTWTRIDYDRAEQSFQQRWISPSDRKQKEDIFNALRVLARLALQTGEPEKASQYAEQASGHRTSRAGTGSMNSIPCLSKGKLLPSRGDTAAAESTYFTRLNRTRFVPSF